MENERRSDGNAGHGFVPPPPVETRGRRSFVELLVDPRTLGGLMASGGGLLVLGLVAWLWSKGVFDNPLVVAIALGAANLGVLAAGIVTVRFTRHQMAGRALTMLACLVMPLNLWFYDAQGLVTIAEGGHLWVPAVFCCLVYVLVARLLADPLFVHAIVAGVTMTGMLLLADSRVGRFWEVIAPSTFLVVLGMVCIHVERAFAPGDGPFSRDRFGRAFFRAGHVVMALGLAVLVVARISGWLYEPWLADLDWFAMPAVATETNLKLLALALVLGAAYSYVYSQVVVQARGRYVASAVLATLWSGVILLDLLAVPFTMEVVAVLVAGAALAANAAAQFAKQRETSADSAEPGTSFFGPLGNTGWTFAAGLNVVGLVLGAVMLFLSHTEPLWPGQDYELSWVYVVAMTITAASWGWTAFLARQSTSMTVEAWNRFGLVATAWFASTATLTCLGMPLSVARLAMEMSSPLALAAVSLAMTDERRRQWTTRAAELGAVLVMLASVGVMLGLASGVAVASPHVWLSLLFCQAAVCLGMATATTGRVRSTVLTAAATCAAVWQLMLLVGLTQHVFVLATMLVGVACLAVNAVLRRNDDEPSRLARATQWTSRLALTFSSVSTLLISLGRMLVGDAEWSLFGLVAAQVAAMVTAGLVERHPAWRRVFGVLATGQVAMGLLVINSLSVLSFMQRVEILLTFSGLMTLAAGVVGWYRETDRRDPWVDFNLAFGSLLGAAPLAVGLVLQRFGFNSADWGWVVAHEVGTLAVGLALLAVGVLCRFRATTIAGATALTVYVVSLVGLIALPDRLQTTAVYMMVGGGLFFGSAVLLSVYRDRLLALPNRVREGKGVFQVLKWR